MKYADAIDALIAAMREELGGAIRASKDAGDYATSEEARAKSKYDTQSTESSYLAAGQASRAEEIATAILELEKLLRRSTSAAKRANKNNPSASSAVEPGSLVECDWGTEKEWYLIVPKNGGTTAKVAREPVTTITAESALGQALLGKPAGQRFKLPTGATGSLGRVLNASH